jgi:hypothetical protein
MPLWKVLFITTFGAVCLALALETVVVPLAMTPAEYPWLWFAGLLLATIVLGTLFTLYLQAADRAFAKDDPRKRY